jgi:2-keto-myo-inositol isomerase
MLLALNGATTMKATLPEDIAATSAAGFKALEIWAAKMVCGLAQKLGCDKIVVVPSPTPEDTDWKDIKDESVRVLRELSEIAALYDVQLAFEFLGFQWCSVRTLDQCWEIVIETDRSNVGLVIDTCHFFAGGSELRSIEQIDPRKIFIFHINDVEEPSVVARGRSDPPR